MKIRKRGYFRPILYRYCGPLTLIRLPQAKAKLLAIQSLVEYASMVRADYKSLINAK